jgi:hypothetical protein
MLLGNSPASEFCMPTFRNTLLHFHRWLGMRMTRFKNVGVFIWEKFWTPGNYPEESIQHSEHGESLKSRIRSICLQKFIL